MESSWLHRYSIVVSACTALLFINGPVVTNNDARPLYDLGQTHLWSGPAVGLLIAGLVVWVTIAKLPAWLKWLAWIAMAANIGEAALGWVDADPLPVEVRVAHSILAQLLFSATVAIALLTSGAVQKKAIAVRRGSLLRGLATATPVLLLTQVALGALHRHGVTGPSPHIAWALVLVVFLGLTLAGILSLEQPGVHAAGVVLTALAGLQMILGFTLFTMQAIDADPTATIVMVVVHATTGALTLASAVALAILVRRIIRAEGQTVQSSAA